MRFVSGKGGAFPKRTRLWHQIRARSKIEHARNRNRPCASFLATALQTRKPQPNWQRAYLSWTTTFGLRIKTYCPETIGPSELEKHWRKPTPWSCSSLPLLRNQNRRVAKCNMPLLLPTTRDGSSPCLCRPSTAFHPTAFPGSSTS